MTTAGKKTLLLAAAALVFLVGCWGRMSGASGRKVFILGVDGLDPVLLSRFMDEGLLPNFKALASDGHFRPLTTTMPPLSPVAWSTFITGMEPKGHGIFDFIHRDPRTYLPQFSIARSHPASWTLSLGSWVIPLKGGTIEPLRRGASFWEILESAGVATTVFRMPVNFPPRSHGHSLSGMGTPDLLGSQGGTFTLFTTNPPPNASKISGGRFSRVAMINNRVEGRLEGPDNPFRRVPLPPGPRGEVRYRSPRLEINFEVFIDPEEPVAKVVIQDNELILKEGEWSDWIRLDFEAIPYLVSVSTTVRLYLKQLRPDFQLYVSPLQINPQDPIMPISTPESWSEELFQKLGYFYTQELAEDTKALSGKVFTEEEFWEQSQFVYREQIAALRNQLDEFNDGLLFFYLSSVDQGCHMMWRHIDPEHPAYLGDRGLDHPVRKLYREVDEAIAMIRSRLEPGDTFIVMSDHGFAPFYWQVNLNSWLAEKGYVTLIDPSRRESPLFSNVDWSRTSAYALGLNGLYVNLRGREGRGIVSPGEQYEKLLDRLEHDLLAMVDPRNGRSPVSLVTRSGDSGGPDLLVGYSRGYRTSWKSPLGEFPPQIFVDNDDAWSGDHSIDYRLVPGVLLSNRRITIDHPALYDLTVAVLDEFGVEKRPGMKGRDCLAHE